MAISLTPRERSVGLTSALNKTRGADASRGGLLSPQEVAKFKGPGAAQLKKAFAYAQNIHYFSTHRGADRNDPDVRAAVKRTSVPNERMVSVLKKLASGITEGAAKTGDKKVLTGNELKFLSASEQALARYMHAVTS